MSQEAKAHQAEIIPLRLNKTARITYADTHIDILDRFLAGLEACDVNDKLEFVKYIEAASNLFALGMSQKAVATSIGITPMTFQRWAKGEHLPYPEPRQAYISSLIEVVKKKKAEYCEEARENAAEECFVKK